MTYLISLILILLYITIYTNSLRNKSAIHYAISIFINVLILSLDVLKYDNKLINIIEIYINNGFISLAFFTIVMAIGVLRNKSKIRSKLRPIRTQLSILACIYTIPHLYIFYNYCLIDLLKINLYNFISPLVSLSLFILFIILFITSFKFFKIKLKTKRWKKIQKLAYPFFFLLYLHLALISKNSISLGDKADVFNLIIYSVIFFIIFALRIDKERIEKDIKDYFFLEIIILIFFILMPYNIINNNINNINNIGEKVITKAPEELTQTIIDEQPDIKIENEITVDTPKKLEESEAIYIFDEEKTSNNIEENEDTLDTDIIQKEEAPEIKEIKKYKDGIYIDMARGHVDYIAVEITIKKDKITDIQIDYQREEPKHFNSAYYPIRNQILEKQTTDVDSISGATHSSEGIIEAVEKALESAKIK
jgi:DMSO/TMAO reductase YedYZ heme-binding membrane subunit/uncharacterized protein with FMN-binding domain